MRTFFLYLSVIQHDNLVCPLNGFKSMRNGNDSMPFDECIYGFLYFHFIFGVK